MFVLNVPNCSVDSHGSVIIVDGLSESCDGMSMSMLSWNACESFWALISVVSN